MTAGGPQRGDGGRQRGDGGRQRGDGGRQRGDGGRQRGDGGRQRGDGGRQRGGGSPPPLDGVLVVTLEQAVAAPFATRQLADLGARVIKIERPGRGDFARDYDSAAGDGMSSWFVWLNRSKESVVLDLKTAGGALALDALIEAADVFVCNLSRAAIARLGLDAGPLAARHPRLIACQLSGYGDDGPYADRKAYDLLVQAEAGVLAVTGSPAEPAKAGISIADIAGGMYAYSGILAALLQRDRTGRGGVVRTSLFAALAEWMSNPMLMATLTGSPPARNGARHASIVPYGSYLTADGHDILLAVQNEAEWVRLCRDVLDLPGPLATPVTPGTSGGWSAAGRWRPCWRGPWPACPRPSWCGGSRRPGSRTPRCGRSGTWWPTRSSRAGGCRSAPGGARCGCCRRRSCTAGSARCSARCRAMVSTPTRCWPSSRPSMTRAAQPVNRPGNRVA